MPTTEEQIKKIIAKHQGKAIRREIARELKISLSYTDLVCQGLLKKKEIKPLAGGFCLLSNLQKKEAKPFPPKQQKSWSKVDRANHEKKTKSNLLSSGIRGLTQRIVKIIEQAGHKTVHSLACTPIVKLMRETNLGVGQVARLINHAREILSKKKTKK